ncbi:hypothetical protein M9411_08605 [Pasteurella multocida]|uniref:hypothetical protein n=1 Tax=Pasteurella multocida TaxID=747 RepID=UPI0020245B8A|nr:hypothetical protein [Pasteurella multocida]URJ84748.1 hypothetical protein M9411_08605 [Pasteurella multocida]
MKVRDWDSFRENIDHEMRRENKTLNKSAHRVDEKRGGKNGIREYSQISKSLDYSNIKSCDYFLVDTQKGHFYCLEFSDLLAQKEPFSKVPYARILKDLRKNSMVERHVIKTIKKITNPNYIIKKELIEKIEDTDILLKYIYSMEFSLINNLPSSSLDKYFFIIYCGDGNSIDNIKFFDNLLDEMKISALNKSLSIFNNREIKPNNIFFMSLDKFEEKYC